MSLGYMTGIPVIGRVSNRPNERRRSSRYRCSGLAEVLHIPRTGNAVQATVSDLSLHGCRILADFSLEFGVLLDLMLRVKSISFRASGNVKVVRGSAGMGIEFTQISVGGQRRLAELLADLDRLCSMPARKMQAPQMIEGEYRPLDAGNLLAQPMLPANADPVPQSAVGPRRRFFPVRAPEVDVFF